LADDADDSVRRADLERFRCQLAGRIREELDGRRTWPIENDRQVAAR